MRGSQLSLFEHQGDPSWPEGLHYRENAITINHEGSLVAKLAGLPFKEFQFHGFEGKRRVVSFGWDYDFAQERVMPADPIPAFLREAFEQVWAETGYTFPNLQQALVTEYSPGAPIGWHKDKPHFADVMG